MGACITSAYWFTPSTSFADPAVTLARAFSNTFGGIRLVDAPMFIVSLIVGAFAATWLFQWLTQALPAVADRVVAAYAADATDRVVGEMQ